MSKINYLTSGKSVEFEEGAENLTKIRKNEIERLGDDINKGYRLACMCFSTGDVRLSWEPN